MVRAAVLELPHALIGGVVGATVAAYGIDAIMGEGILGKVLIPALIAPTLAFVVAVVSITIAYRIVGRLRARAGDAGLSASARSSRAACWRSRTGPTTRRRRWA